MGGKSKASSDTLTTSVSSTLLAGPSSEVLQLTSSGPISANLAGATFGIGSEQAKDLLQSVNDTRSTTPQFSANTAPAPNIFVSSPAAPAPQTTEEKKQGTDKAVVALGAVAALATLLAIGK